MFNVFMLTNFLVIPQLNMYIYIYIYIYIYSVIHKQTVLLYHNTSVWLDCEDAWSWDRNPHNFTLDLVSDCSANKRTTSAREL